jgi:hypothetical protein
MKKDERKSCQREEKDQGKEQAVARRWCLLLVYPIRRGGSAPGRVEELGAWTTGVRGYATGN